MTRPEEVLKNVRVASPCPANWDSMDGDDQIRFCSLCRLNVYNLSAMTELEAARLVAEREGRLCVRYYQRRDGTVLTRDCPVGIRAVRKRIANAVACGFVLFTAGIAYASRLSNSESSGSTYRSVLADAKVRLRKIEPFRTVLDWIDPPAAMGAPAPPTTGRVMVGAVAAPWPSSTAQTPPSNRKSSTPVSPHQRI